MPAPLTLRTSLTPDLMNLPSQDFVNNYATHDLAGSSSLRRGWVSAGMSSDGSDMLFQAAEAYKSGDAARGAALEQQGRDMMARSQQWAPSVQDFTDIQSADDLGTWLGGQVGNLRTSVPPVLGGLGGAAVGGFGGALVGGLPGAVAGATWGSRLGAGLLGYQGERNEAAAQAMMDDEIRRTRTYDDILNASRTKGAVAGALESIVPGGLAKTAVLGMGKAAAKQGAKALIGKEVAKNAGEEFLTEGAQELTGQAAQNWLKQDDLTNFDYTDAFNAGMGGLVGGGVMGGAGAAMQVGRNALAGETPAPTQEADPNKSKLDAVLDKTVELAGKAGSKVGALAERYTNPHAEFLRTATTDPKDLTDEQVVDMYKGSADKLADAVLTNPQQYRNEEIQAAAAKYKQDGDWSTFRAAILGNERKSKMSEMLTDFDNGAKNSEMSTPFGDQMGKLSEAWLSNEGKKYKHVFDDSDDAKLLGKKLFGWIASDFGAQHNQDDDGNPQHFIPKTLVRELGDRAADVISNAIAAARKEGVPVDNQRANTVLKELRTTLKDESHDTGLLTGALKYTAERSWTPKMLGQLARELRQSGGKLDKEDRSWFESQFNDADDLLKRFAEPSKSEYYKAKNELKKQRYEDTEAISQSGGLEEEEANNADSPDSGHDAITDNDGDWNSGIQQIEDRAKRTFRSLDRDGTPYDTADPEQNALFTSKLSTLQNDPAVFVKPIGIWRRVRDAAKGNAALLREYEDDLLRAHGNDLAVEGTFHGELNPEDLTAAERVTLLGKINRRFKTIEVEGVEPAKDPHKIPKGEIASFRVDAVTKGDGPKRRDMGAMRAKDGFLFLERVISGKTSYFPTTVSRLLMHMRGRGDWAGAANIDKEVQVAGKDKGAALALSHLEQALADLITSDATFTGRIGYLADGKEQRPIMLDQKAKLPKELPLGEGATVATAMRRRASEARWGWSEHEENTNSEGHTQEPYVEPKLIAGQDDGGNKIVSGVNVVDDFGNLKNNIGDRAADRKIVHGAKEGASKAVTQLRTREKFHTKQLDIGGNDVATKSEAEQLRESLRDSLAGELSVVNRDGKWGVLQKTQEQSRDQGVVSEVDEMSSGSAERFEKTIREFQEETGLSLEVNVPDGLRTFAGNVIRNARVAYRLATEQEKGRLGKLIAARRFRSANLLSDTIRNKREEVSNEGVGAAVGRHTGGGISSPGRHTSTSGVGGVHTAGNTLPKTVLGRAGMDSQDRKADGNRDAGKGDQGQRASVTKQDAWVMKIASMSMKDMKAAIRALPAEKLDAAFDLLETFFPVDNSNPFWQRNNLDNFHDKMLDVLGEAQDVLRDRLSEDAKNSEQGPVLQKGPHSDKDQAKSDKANKFIGRGSAASSTEAYRKAWGVRANTGVYLPSDTVFVSAEGNRQGRIAPNFAEIARAMDAGATLITDNEADRNRQYNRGEREVAKFLSANGYAEYSPGVWKKVKNSNVSSLSDKRVEKLLKRAEELANSLSDEDFNTLQNDVLSSDLGRSLIPTSMKDAFFEWLEDGYGAVEMEKKMSHENIRATEEQFLEEVADSWDGHEQAMAVHILAGAGMKSIKNSEQNPTEAKLNADEAVEFLKRAFGKDFDAEVVADLGGKAGTWKPGLIRMAAAAPNGVQYHEALHEFFSQLKQHGSDNVRALIERVASNPIMIRKLERLLEKHPKAQAQLKTPEEAAAFMYQFHQLGLLNVGPETSTLFGKIAKLIANAAKALRALVDTEYRDTRNKEKSEQADIDAAFKALSLIGSGALAEADSKQAILDALRANVEAHDKVLENLGKGVDDFHRKVGKMVMSTEAMMELTRDKGLIEVMRAFHQKAGTAMLTHESKGGVVSHGGFSEAVHAETGRWLNRLDNLLRGVAKEDIALAMPYLEAGTVPTDKVVADIVSKVRKFNSDIFQALTDADIRRLEISEKGEPKWVPMEARRNYFSQVWDVDSLMKDPDGFVKKLLDKHRDELERIAKASNAEIEAYRAGEEKLPAEGTAARAEIDRVTSSNAKYQDVTPEMVAEAIYGRLINSGGLADLEENEASMGITPGAAAINRRSLTWLDPETFSEYKSKDLVNIMTTYTRSMIKRAEYQKRFGYGGEKITDAVDMAFLRQLGGEELASYAEAALPSARKEWRKAAAEWYEKTKEKYPEPFPTLRLIGLDYHRAEVGAEEHAKAVIAATKAMEPAVNGIKALEGTLGADASQTAKTINSWMVTYTNLRTLPLMLFTNISDVIGLTVQGGNLSDAWNAFVTGMREVRNTWVGEKDRSTTRGEMWGAVDAGSWMDSLGQGYGSAFMTSGAKKINDKFFKMVGAEGWNRGVRAVAATVAERLILDWVKNGVDFKNAAEKARFERLYGEGFKPENIALDPDGNLDINDARNRAAVNRWVMDAVMTSNAAHRPIWASDPRFQTFIHLKNFAYTFHRVMLKGIIEQAKLGNYRPALVALTGYAPVAIASGAVKEMLIPGEEPPWMQGGLDGYLDYGIGQANLLGVPQMYWNSATDPARALGPIYDQVQNLISVPMPKVGFMDERALDEELVKALPGGNVLSRAVKD